MTSTLSPSRPWALLLTLLALLLARVPQASAAPGEDATKAKARSHFQRGEIHYDLKEYSQALEEFKNGYRLVQDPVFLFNIAQCHYRLGQNREALDFYKNYRRRSPDAPNRSEVDRRIQELERAGVTAPPPAPEKPAPTPPPVTPAPTAPPVVLAPPPPAAPPPVTIEATEPPPADVPSPFYKKWWFWTGVGAVVVAGVVVAAAAGGGGTQVGDCTGITPCLRVKQ